MKIKKINANLSHLYLLKDFGLIIKQLKDFPEWTRGGIVIATQDERIKNSVAAYKNFPEFFPKIKLFANKTYIREFVNSPTLEENPEKLEEVIEKLFAMHKEGIVKVKKEKNIKIQPLGELWKSGYYLFGSFLNIKDFDSAASILTYNVGDAKKSNLLSDSRYLTFDAEGFGIGDISTDIVALIESYQYHKKPELFEKTLRLVSKKYSVLDKNIIKKSLLGLIGIRSLEVIAEGRNKEFFDSAIELFGKYKNA